MASLALEREEYFLVTMHRVENVDDSRRLGNLLEGVRQLEAGNQQPVVVSMHPRTLDRIRAYGLEVSDRRISLLEPFGFIDFVALERHARCVITDSGTVQEECCILRVPNVTIRDVTERPETVECGSNCVTGVQPADLLLGVRLALSGPRDWSIPPEYLERQCSISVGKIVLGRLPVGRDTCAS